ncbi:NAD-dependent epimerase/dehydratase family protein [Actinoplanes sp. NPDC049681]|uniref:NAD-dependent epimerase/dehydratase family protein n=1 Tax=Actinoplanes sp. NPDC049681 TaxID=3363905 RepID=UPI0037AD2ECD
MRNMFRLSGAVMAHPTRSVEAERLAGLDPQGRLRVVLDPEPEGPPTALRTAAAAWAAVDHGATHHLVLQDDVLLAEGFFEHVAVAAEAALDDAIAFYANWNSRNGAAVRAAALAGAAWAAALDEYAPCVALMLPARMAAGYGASAAGDDAGWPYDVLMHRYLKASGTRLRISVPNTVEHAGLPSIAGNSGHGLRRSALFTGVAPDPDRIRSGCAALSVVPFIKHGSAQVAVRTGNGWEYLEAERHLLRSGWSARTVRRDFESVVAGTGLPREAAWNTWVAAFVLGTAQGRHATSAPAADAALRTLGPGGVCDELSPAQVEALVAPLHELARTALAAGRAAARGPRPRVSAMAGQRDVTAVTGADGQFARALGGLLADLGNTVRHVPGPVTASDIAGCTRLVHLAHGEPAGQGAPEMTVRHVLDAARTAGVRRLVYAVEATATACGGDTVVPERFRPEPPPGAAGLDRWQEEESVRRWAGPGEEQDTVVPARTMARSATVLRYAEPVGAHVPTATVTADWILRAWTRRELPLEADRRHQLVDIRDLASAVHAALTVDAAGPRLVHVASAVHDEAAWAAQVVAVTRRTARTVHRLGTDAAPGSRRPILDTDLTGTVLDWKPTAPLAAGLRAQAQWLAYDTECC